MCKPFVVAIIISSRPSCVKSNANIPYADADNDKTRQIGNDSAGNDKPSVIFSL
jgi:hypothetical protein